MFSKESCLDPPRVVPEKKILVVRRDKLGRWRAVRPYYNYCDFCGQKNYEYGTLLYGPRQEKEVVDWGKVIDADGGLDND